LLLAVLPALRLPMKLRLDVLEPWPMLSASAAVMPLRPVPVGVWSSLEPTWGTFRSGCFCLPSASYAAEAAVAGVSRSVAGVRGMRLAAW
jgi:hypothetical protein